MDNKRVFVFMFFALFISGCASAVKYPFTSELYRRDEPLKHVVLVDVVDDARSKDEQLGVARSVDYYLYTKDKDFTPDIKLQVSNTMVEHLQKAKMFRVVQVRDLDNNLELNPAEMEKLAKEGVDIVIIARLTHFYGYQSGTAGAAVAFGLVGALTEAIANPKTVGGEAEYEDMKVIDVVNQKLLWKGTISHDFKDKVIFYDGPVTYSLRALKGANDKVSQKLEELL